MGSRPPFLIPLDRTAHCDERITGGKAAKLARLAGAGFTVPAGFVLTTAAYQAFIDQAKITTAIRMELGRKPMDEMRWEEIWDTALRIRSLFLSHALPGHLLEIIADGMTRFDKGAALAVRSSAVGEDSAGRSFAGLHESIIGVRGPQAVADAVRLVWASLWSDAALLYRKELGLDPLHSRMAVLVQEMVDRDRSGVAFARDPRDTSRELAIIESVPGTCSLLVDGAVDPDRWEIDRDSRTVITWLPGAREDGTDGEPLLQPRDLNTILDTLLSVEALFEWAPDMEWTGRSGSLTVLQARPITTVARKTEDKRDWYLTLRPGDARLRDLRQRVAGRLIPQLEEEARVLAEEDLAGLDDRQLADTIDRRSRALARWKKIYLDEFIPFAHGVRRLATYYNDAVRPEDPYEFVGLLRDQPLLAARRNRAIDDLARQLAADSALHRAVEDLLAAHAGSLNWTACRRELAGRSAGAREFVRGFEELNERHLDITYDRERLGDRPEPLLRIIAELSKRPPPPAGSQLVGVSVADLEQRLLEAVGPQCRDEATGIMETGRVSWKLRDDDNLLVARLESQLLRALGLGAERLRGSGRLTGDGRVTGDHALQLAEALREPPAEPMVIEEEMPAADPGRSAHTPGETPRQLIGQPASPGVASGLVRCIRGREDLGAFRQGEVLVCDAIQPTMTHLVMLAGAIVERRGGMLIHGAIIARELGIPCVNGVRQAAEILSNGDLVTVDGHLGIVTVGEPVFDLELGQDRPLDDRRLAGGHGDQPGGPL